MKKFRFALLLLALLLCFAACKKLPTLTPSAQGYLHSDGGLYLEAPINYIAASRSKDAVATLTDATGKHPLYDAGKGLLCTEGGELYAEEGTLFPSLREFYPTKFVVCKEEVARTEILSSRDAEILQSIVLSFKSLLLDPEEWDLLQEFENARYFLLLFSEEDYPDLCFRLEYYLFDKNEDPYKNWTYGTDRVGFLYDRDKNLYTVAPTALDALFPEDFT